MADFIGEINFFDGVVTTRDGALAEIDAGPLGPVRANAGGAAGTSALVALRPEKITLSADASPGAVAGTVIAAAYLGERSHYNIAIAGRTAPVSVAAQNAQKIVTRGHTPGDQVYLSWAPDALVILPP